MGAARLDPQVDAAQGLHRFGLAVAGREGEGEIVDLEQRFHEVRVRGVTEVADNLPEGGLIGNRRTGSDPGGESPAAPRKG